MSPTPVSSTILIFYSTATAEATYTYDAYGNTTATTGGTFATTTNPWRYGGGYTDPSGTIKLGARYYNPTTGRFTQPDPSGQETNNYVYAGNNPITNSGPNGLSIWGDIGAAIGAVGTGVALLAMQATPPGWVAGAGFALAASGVFVSDLDLAATASEGDDTSGTIADMQKSTDWSQVGSYPVY